MSFKDTKWRRLLTALPLLLAALLLVASAPARAETITGQFSYLDFGDNNPRWIPGTKVEIFRFTSESGGWGKYGEVSTDLYGRIAVEIPGETSGGVYFLRVHASNRYVTVLGPSGAFFEDMPHQTVSYPDEVLDFTYLFEDFDAAKFFNVASAGWYAGDLVRQAYTDLPQTEVEVSPGNSFYRPRTDTVHIDLDRAFDDEVILHEYGHFVHDKLGSLMVESSCNYDLCTVSTPEYAFMEGFADFFQRTILRWMPDPEGPSRDLEPIDSASCELGPPRDSIELFTAATLWDLMDPRGYSSEYHDVFEMLPEIFHLLDTDPELSGQETTIWDLRGALSRLRKQSSMYTYDEVDLDRLYAWHGLIPDFNLSQCVRMDVPTTMLAGRTYTVGVTMLNTGSTAWEIGRQQLGSQSPEDNLTWGLNRVDGRDSKVYPNGAWQFSFNVTAPATPGSYTFQWRMVDNEAGWFGGYTPMAVVNVVTEIESAQYVSQSVPNSMTADRTYAVSVTMRNIGDTTWTPGTHFLGSQNPQDNSNWGLNRVALPASVPPGGQVTFNFNAKAPSQSGSYNFQWRMLQNGIGWFGDYTPTAVVNVTRIESARYLSQSVPVSMTTGGTYTVSVTLYNSGDTTWTPSTHFLGSQNPQDNLNWGLNRVALPASVPPGGQVTFYFNVKAPSWPGSYGFQWRMLQNGIGWFGEYTPNVSVSVKAPSTCNAMDCANECIASGCRGGSCSTGRCVCLRCL